MNLSSDHLEFQYALSGDPAKPCYVLSISDLLIMLDCGLSVSSVLNFLPLPLVQSAKFQSLLSWNCRDPEIQLEDGVSDSLHLQGLGK